jgi:hypothetical protein
MFVFIHVNVPLPCLGTGSQCGSALSFDVVNDNVFLTLLSASGPGSGAPPAPAGAWEPVGCRGPVRLPQSGGNYMYSLADCLNVAMAANWVYAGMSVCGNNQLNCRNCFGCNANDVVSGTCTIAGLSVTQYNNVSDPSYPCDPMGGLALNPAGTYIYLTFLCALCVRLLGCAASQQRSQCVAALTFAGSPS